jgi:hypothetical protein
MSIALERALERLAFAEAAKKALVKLLELEPMGGRPGGRATWDDVIAYVAKLKGGHQLANSNTRRRGEELAAALHAPDSATWPELVAMAEANIGQCTTNVHNSEERCVYGAFHPGECDA